VKRFSVKVIPRSSINKVIEMDGGTLKVKLSAPPVDGAANSALGALLAEHFGVKKNQIRIISGLKSQTKIVEVSG
jgi:uncharacterized protein (TIGR00251 family)